MTREKLAHTARRLWYRSCEHSLKVRLSEFGPAATDGSAADNSFSPPIYLPLNQLVSLSVCAAPLRKQW